MERSSSWCGEDAPGECAGSSRAAATHYDVLGVGSDVGIEELKKAYRKAILRTHPDKILQEVQMEVQGREAHAQVLDGGEDSVDGADDEAFMRVHRAFKVLSDDGERYR